MNAVDRAAPPAAGPRRAFRPPPFRRARLANGLELVLAPRDGAPLVEALLLLPAGGDRNPAHRPGLAALTAALLDEGSRRRTGLELALDLEGLGASLGAGADWDAARLEVTALAEHLEPALRALAEVAREPVFPAAEVERLRNQTLAEIRRLPDQPARLADRALAAALYPGSPYAHLPHGTAESVAGIGREEIVDFHARRFAPRPAQLVLGGAFDAERATDLVAELFAGWTGEAPSAPPAEPPPQPGARVRIVDLPRAEQTELRVGQVGVPRRHPDRTRLGVLNALLGGKFTSRLNLNLRERHGFTYGVSSRFVDRRGAGPFVVATSVATAAAGAATAEILAELERLCREPVGEPELAETRDYLLGVFPYTFQTVAGQVARLADLALHGLPDDHLERALAEIAATTSGDLSRLANDHLRPSAAVIVAVGPAATIGPQLAAFGEVEVTTAT